MNASQLIAAWAEISDGLSCANNLSEDQQMRQKYPTLQEAYNEMITAQEKYELIYKLLKASGNK
jgi:hypothetical protein